MADRFPLVLNGSSIEELQPGDNLTGLSGYAKYDDATASFSGILRSQGSNVVLVADIGSLVQAYDNNLTTFVQGFNLPINDGFGDQAIVTDGSGNLRFASVGGISASRGIAMSMIFGY
jgi:hypothetical protein